MTVLISQNIIICFGLVLLVLFINFSKNASFLKSLHFKSGCKGKGLFYNHQMFLEVFFSFFSEGYLTALLRKEKNLRRKKRLLFANRNAKIRTFKHWNQIFWEVFLFNNLAGNPRFQHVKLKKGLAPLAKRMQK